MRYLWILITMMVIPYYHYSLVIFLRLANGNVIQVLVFALIFGFATSLIKSDVPHFVDFINELNTILTKLIIMIINLAPIAVACILIETFAI